MTRTGDFLTTAQVAEILRLDVATVNKYAAEGRIAVAQKLPGRTGPRLFHPDVVDAFKREREGAAA